MDALKALLPLCILAAVGAIVYVVITLSEVAAGRLQVQGNHFVFNGQRVFLSGGNLPWINYGHDFGNNQWAGVKDRVKNQLQLLHQAGGNSIRIWIHVQGETTPLYDSNGHVIGPDSQGTLYSDIKDMLDLAQSYDILVFPTLWNAAVDQDYNHHLEDLIRDYRKLREYIDKVLKPMVAYVKGHPALGAWDIINEPEGMIRTDLHNVDKCFDTTALRNSGAGWAGKKFAYTEINRFINWIADAIKSTDPGVLVTAGVWNPKSNTDRFGMVNHYTDSCLIKEGQMQQGTLDFYQYHSYSWQGKFDDVSPFKHSYGNYGVNKPIVVGEFWEQDGGGMNITQLFDYVYNNGYAGAWSWDLVGRGTNQRKGISHIRSYTSNGKIPIDI